MRQFSLSEVAVGYARAVFKNGDRNFLNSQTITDLDSLITDAETQGFRVVVLESAVPDFFMARYDITGDAPDPKDPFANLRKFLDVTSRLAASPVIWIAEIRGRTRGGGNEIVLACDLRYASRERAIFGQPEVASGLLPAGGGLERLVSSVGRARALEIVASGFDFDAVTAESWGWVNRTLPDRELGPFVDALARRLASFDAVALAETKRLVGRSAMGEAAAIQETISALPSVAVRTTARRGELARLAAAEGPTFELELGDRLGPTS